MEVKTLPIQDVSAIGRKFLGSDGQEVALGLGNKLDHCCFPLCRDLTFHQTGIIEVE